MKLAIIGAGEGSRLKAEGVTVPKPLIKIDGIPIIERILRIAAANGITSAHLIINENFKAAGEYIQSLALGISIDCELLSTPSSMHTLFALAPKLGDEPFCMTTVDSVFIEDEFRGFLGCAKIDKEAHGTLAVTGYIHDEKPLCVTLDSNNRILKFSDSRTEWATGGIYYFSSTIFNEIESALESRIQRLRNFLRLLIAKGYILKAYPFSKIIDIDHISDIIEAEQFIRTNG